MKTSVGFTGEAQHRGLRSLVVRCMSSLLLGWLLAAVPGAVRAAEPIDELTPAQREQLQKDAAKLNEQAVQLYSEGKYTEAARRLEQALAMRRRLYPAKDFPRGHPDLATSLNNLGALLQAQGEYGKALPYYEQALAMRRRLYPAKDFPRGHPDLAVSLNNLGGLLEAQGEYGKALPYYEQALAMYQRLYPANDFPRGHPDLATSLNNLGALLQAQGEYSKALPYYEQALAMNDRLYPEKDFPHGHRALARSLNNLGSLLQDQEEYSKALTYLEQALAMYRRLYPAKDFPRGHPDLAVSLNNLGGLLEAQGEYGKALPYYEQALAMRRRLYPDEDFPRGHPQLAASLNNLGGLLWAQGEYRKALPYLEQAVALCRRLYPDEDFPRGHPQLAASLNNLGGLLWAQGEYRKALPYLEQAVALRRRLYPDEDFPRGHPDLALSLNNLGGLLYAQGEYGRALLCCEQALAMYQRLYPEKDFPRGHPDLALSLHNLGELLEAQGEYAKALPYYARALAMYQKQFQHLADSASEAEALALTKSLPLTQHALLSVAAHVSGSDATAYVHVWQSKAALTRVLERRHLARLAAAESLAARDKWQALLDTRRHLDRLLAVPARDAEARESEVRELTDRKERLERELAEVLPQLPRRRELEELGPDSLAKRLPDRTAFIDLLRYTRLDYDPAKPGKKGVQYADQYVAFLLTPGQAARRVELGPAKAIDKEVAEWRQAIVRGEDSPAGTAVRRLVWEPVRRLLPEGTETVYLSPDGDLARLPWAALPGDNEGTVLLEQYTLAVVPHGPFLLERLLYPAKPTDGPGRLLAVGGVTYGDDPRPKQGYPALPGSAAEVRQILALAGERPKESLEEGAATVDALVRELPRARSAHLATHGFFKEAAYRQEVERVRKQREAWAFNPLQMTERVGIAARSPLGFTGLVLAGANQPKEGDSGILTGEGLVELPLEGLDLVVLSACETGLGAAVGREEGVAGLHRAFHLAGARNVMVSLWHVDDAATVVLMEEFYKRLWDKDQPLPPARALRQAQLAVLRDPGRVFQKYAELRNELVKRGVPEPELQARGFGKELKDLPDKGQIEERRRSPARWWAGFVLSGCDDPR
jgi:CHAT domain-containing protein/Flp pilus assembly protein TadD